MKLSPFWKPRGGTVAFVAEYQAIINYAVSKGWSIPSYAEQVLGNQLVVALKSDGVWNGLDGLFMFATGGDVNFACINWKSPGDATNATRVNSPTFTTKKGFSGDGVSSYVDLSYNPFTTLGNFTQNNASIFLWCDAAATVGDALFGNISAVQIFNRIRNINAISSRINTSNNAAVSLDFSGTGFKHLSRQSSTNIRIYNDLAETITTATSNTLTNQNNFCTHRSGTSYSNAPINAVGFGLNLNTLNDNIRTALNNYLTSI